MHGAKGVLINITGGDDITLMEIDEAASIIKEEVDDNANIIFGSSYDENLAGKIRVSIVVTGINDGKPQPEIQPRTKEPSLIDQSYDDSSFVPTVMPAVELPETSEPVSLDIKEDTISPLETPAEDVIADTDIENSLVDDFSSLDKSDELPEVPQGTALFNAIMNSSANKTADAEAGSEELNAATAKDNDFFFSSTSLQDVSEKDEEPVLFKEHDSDIFKDVKPAENAAENDENAEDGSDVKPTFIERVIGIRSRKKKEETEELPENIVKFSSDDNNDVPELSSDELDIPSFLRRK